jgi:glutathione S-transferase
MIGPDRSYVAAEELTIADYLGGSVIALLETVDFDFAPYPNVIRWLRGLRALRSWEPTFAAFEGLRTALRPAA